MRFRARDRLCDYLLRRRNLVCVKKPPCVRICETNYLFKQAGVAQLFSHSDHLRKLANILFVWLVATFKFWSFQEWIYRNLADESLEILIWGRTKLLFKFVIPHDIETFTKLWNRTNCILMEVMIFSPRGSLFNCCHLIFLISYLT